MYLNVSLHCLGDFRIGDIFSETCNKSCASLLNAILITEKIKHVQFFSNKYLLNIFFHPTFLLVSKWNDCTWNAYRRFINISFSACQHNVCIKASGQQKLHKYDQYIYTDNSQLIKGGQFKLGPHQVSLDKLNSPHK